MELPMNVTTSSHGAFYWLQMYITPYSITTTVTEIAIEKKVIPEHCFHLLISPLPCHIMS
ncbi:hypothetical protein HanPSC8_Chr14g0599171 [Helianthus annuus]|nr:hypothetical protein HanPSC8_Chr14g0599171 [Helianthus annuus]